MQHIHAVESKYLNGLRFFHNVCGLQIFKFYLQQDSSDNGPGPVLMRGNSRKKAKLMSEPSPGEAVLREGDADAMALEERSTSGQAPATAEPGLTHQHSTGTVSEHHNIVRAFELCCLWQFFT